uniref:Uncharacterized protein n=1 Tax=Timema poppense TaxID=170557 RepID=A0A7R9D0C7_TIMPO|nr:unnamed protein product [Timema poppensis]
MVGILYSLIWMFAHCLSDQRGTKVDSGVVRTPRLYQGEDSYRWSHGLTRHSHIILDWCRWEEQSSNPNQVGSTVVAAVWQPGHSVSGCAPIINQELQSNATALQQLLYSRSGQSHVAKYILAGRLPFWVKQGAIQEVYFVRGKSQCSGGQDGGNGQPKNKSQPSKKNHVVGSQTGGKSQCSTSEPKSQCSKSEPKSQCAKSEPKSQCSKPVAKLQGSKLVAEPQCLPPQTIPGAPTFTKFSPGAKPQSDIPAAPMVKSCGKRVPAGVKATYRGKECFKPQAIQKLQMFTIKSLLLALTTSPIVDGI